MCISKCTLKCKFVCKAAREWRQRRRQQQQHCTTTGDRLKIPKVLQDKFTVMLHLNRLYKSPWIMDNTECKPLYMLSMYTLLHSGKVVRKCTGIVCEL